jgi:hypothetical protein
MGLKKDLADARESGSPALCENLRPAILQLLAGCKNAPLGADEPREG